MDKNLRSKHKILDGYEHLVSDKTKELLEDSGVTLEIEEQFESSSAYPLYIAAFEGLFPLSPADKPLDNDWVVGLSKARSFFLHINRWVKDNDSRCRVGKIHSWLIVKENNELSGDYDFTDSRNPDAKLIKKGVVVGFAYGDDATIREMAGKVDRLSSEAVLASALKSISMFQRKGSLQVSFRHGGFILDAMQDIPKSAEHDPVLEDRMNKAIMAISLKSR